MILTLALAASALAETPGTDIDQHAPEVSTKAGAVETSFSFSTSWNETSNTDFRPLDESSDQAILDSDDRGEFAMTGLYADVAYTPKDDVSLVVSVSHRGAWGADQIGGTDAYGGWVFFYALYADWMPKGKAADGEHTMFLRVGRQNFEIGGNADMPEYALHDIIDGVRFDVPLGPGALTVLPISVVAGLPAENDYDFFRYVSQNSPAPFGFRGDTTIRRSGLQYTLDGVSDKFDARAYAFYTDIGATDRDGTGADITYGGELGNFADNDWVANFGARAEGGAGPVKAWLQVDGSSGIDRKELVAQDVDCNGYAGAVGVRVDTGDEDSGLHAHASLYDALGPAYTDNGLLWSHGYVGMKGDHDGGLVAGQFLGWRPSAYVGTKGVDDDEQDKKRNAGTMVIDGEFGYDLPGPLSARVQGWMFKDTGATALDTSKEHLTSIDPPYGYSREEFAAEARLGKTLGTEADATVGLDVNDHVHFYTTGGMLKPGAFYAVNVDRSAGRGDSTQLGGTQTAWAWVAGTEIDF